jgi:hypothetical protein
LKTLRDLLEHLADMDEEELDKELHLTVWDHEDNWNCSEIDINTEGICSDLQLILVKGCTVSYGTDKVFKVLKR